MGRTSLYRHYDRDGRLLYVGISGNHIKRTSQHHRDSEWFWSVSRIELEHFPNRESAEIAEATAIRDEKPIHNKASPEPMDTMAVIERRRQRCSVPSVAGPGPFRVLGYADVPLEKYQTTLGFFRKCGIPDTLIFIDVHGQSIGAFGSCIKIARHEGICILDLSDGRFDDFLDLMDGRGVYVHTVRGNGSALYAEGDDITDLLDMVATEQNAANVRKSRNKV